MRRSPEKDEVDSHCYVDRHTRTITLTGEITQSVASKFRRHLRSLERSNRGITIEINSPGGDIEAGLMIIDTIVLSKRPITTRVTGQAYSMACVIACSGTTREMLPCSFAMAHQGSFVLSSTYDNLDNDIDFLKNLEDKCWQIMDDRTNKKRGYWKKKCGTKDYYMNADISLREGLIDKICTKD